MYIYTNLLLIRQFGYMNLVKEILYELDFKF